MKKKSALTTQEISKMSRKEMANHINEIHSELLFSLYERWQDERDYEDFNDYIKRFKKSIKEIVSGSKRPFGFVVRCSDGDLRVSVKVAGKFLKLFYTNEAKA